MPATFDLLRVDHEEALDRVDRASRALQAVRQGRPLETVRPALEDLGSFVDHLLTLHFTFEEEVFFPLLAGFDEMKEPIDELVDGFGAIRDNNRRLAAELRNEKPDPGVIMETVGQIINNLNTHIRLCDLEVFPFARRRLNREQFEEVELRMRERTAPPPTYPLPRLEL